MTDRRRMMELALPAMMEQMLQMLMGMLDAYLIAFMGVVAISGVSLASSILSVYQAIFIALGAAVSALVAKNFGRGERKSLENQVGEAIKLTFLLGGGLGVVSIFFGGQLLVWLGAEASVVSRGGQYLGLVGGGILSLGLMTVFGAILRSTGRSRLPMYVSLLSNLLNLLLSAFLVYICQLGVIGVALGTLLSRMVGCFVLWRSLRINWRISGWSLDRELLQLALPAAGERLMMRAGDVVVVALIVSLGTATVAGNAIGETLTQFNYMPGLGFASAVVILVAQARGERDMKRAKYLARLGFLLSLASMLAIAMLTFLFRHQLIALYTQDRQAEVAALTVLLYALLGNPATAGTLTYTAFWQGIGRAQLPFYATSLGMWVIRIGFGFLLTQIVPLGVAGIWLATILDNLFRWGFLYFSSKKLSI